MVNKVYYINMNDEITLLKETAEKAAKEPKIKRHLKTQRLLARYRNRWYKYDDEGNITQTPSDRMTDWVQEIETFNFNLNNLTDRLWNQESLDKFAELGTPMDFEENARIEKLWDAYCKYYDEPYITDPSDCLC